jgi:hypothetical protein
VYYDPSCHASLTGVIHATRLRPRFATNFFSTARFFADCATGDLPAYSFIEPQIIGWAHNDMHPPFTYLFEAVARSRGVDPGAASSDPPSYSACPVPASALPAPTGKPLRCLQRWLRELKPQLRPRTICRDRAFRQYRRPFSGR